MSRWLRAGALISACGALVVVGAGLLCVGTHEEGLPCAGLCAANVWTRGDSCVTPVAEVAYEPQLLAAVMDTVAGSQPYASPHGARSAVLIQAQPVSGREYLRDPSFVAAVRSAALPESGDSLVRDFETRNAHNSSLKDFYELGPNMLDSAAVRTMLEMSDAEALLRPPTGNLLTQAQVDSPPGILALSRPGITPSGRVALEFAMLRDRRSTEPDHLEAAAFLVLRRDGARWIVTHEIPVSLKRGP